MSTGIKLSPQMPSTSSPKIWTKIAVVPRISCCLCGDDGKELYTGMADCWFGAMGTWGLRTCADCGIAWLDPQPTKDDIPKLYSRYYTHTSLEVTAFERLRREIRQCILARMGYRVEPSTGLLPRLLSRWGSFARAAAMDVLNLSASEVGTLLDVGCGNGEFISRMHSLGWNVSGVDPDPAAVAFGRSHKLSVFQGTISDVPPDLAYDVITLNHVIEHVPDPVELLRECGKRLRPKTGRLIITTPNLKSLGHRWFDRYWRGLEFPRHLVLFSPRGLSEYVTRAGLRVTSMRTETRLARMIYTASVYARRGEQLIGERTSFRVTTKSMGYGFQLLEDALLCFKEDAGEEIHLTAIWG